ncbi:flagellar basal body P-ring formation chaperone FlgA [Dethiosulfovibrio sp. F2B]|uniref:flagellar basal body P-ring formation chaperone FlgA n=1 Tax=Dethiosulfovibrio faecalis TaxID=2720018 RepID=UPI001F3EDEC1|nr:flagellar basal body P-ring formation chaperone FlgA [Dethiosulfovibrio faecalis]MCF4152436.1 flagellar basal body P-ring formation chaperone FlgA [Dethiosulfovibrio faecalis]
MVSSNAGRRVLLRARLCRIIALMAIFSVLSFSTEALELSVEINSGVVVPSGPIRLKDVAYVACDSPEILTGSSSSILRSSGNVITPEDVVVALTQAGIGGVSLRLLMADRVPFRRENDVERWLRNYSGWTGALEVESDAFPSGGRLIPPDSLYPGAQAVNLRFDVAGVEQICPARLRWLLPAVVADSYLRKGVYIKNTDLAVTVVEVRRNRKYYDDPKDLVGMTVERDMARGDPFTVRITEEPELVRTGDIVRLLYRSGSLLVSTSGRAMDRGALGDRIKVRNDKTRKIVFGIVTGPGTVEVSE